MKISNLFAMLLVIAWSSGCLADQAIKADNCAAFRALYRVASGKNDVSSSTSSNYAGRLFLAMGAMRRSPRSAISARYLLDIAPKKNSEVDEWLATGVQSCSSSSDGQLRQVIKFRDSLPVLLGWAVKLVPEKMDDYLKFNIVASTAAEEDYLRTLPAVCEARKASFLEAVNRLSDKDRAWLSNMVVDLKTCKRIR